MSIEAHQNPEAVLGNVLIGQYVRSRTPLHIDFDSSPEMTPPTPLYGDDADDLAKFNAVGSLVNNTRDVGKWHFPVIDADGGAQLLPGIPGVGSKAVLGSAHEGTYEPGSLLRDVLHRNGMDVEIFQSQKLVDPVTGFPFLKGPFVDGIVLRAKKADVFRVFDSSSEGHSHLYIDQNFTDEHHKILIHELGRLGIVSERWAELSEQSGMSVVRTPWAKKQPGEMPSH